MNVKRIFIDETVMDAISRQIFATNAMITVLCYQLLTVLKLL